MKELFFLTKVLVFHIPRCHFGYRCLSQKPSGVAMLGFTPGNLRTLVEVTMHFVLARIV